MHRPARSALRVNALELLRQPGQHRHVDVTVSLEDVDAQDARLDGDVAVDVTLVSTLDDVVVNGRLTVAWSDTCRRCLRPLADDLVIEVEERYAPPDETGLRPVDPEAFPIEHGQLDLAAMVREEVLLGVPDAPLCQPDCAGLCPVCGTDRQVGTCDCDAEERDERWAALDVLKADE